jgi:hypothetical protein
MMIPDADTNAAISVKQWLVASLPFSPAAINDANLVVGEQTITIRITQTQRTRAVQFQNGTLEVLPFIVDDGGFSSAVDVSSLGAIVGKTNNIDHQPAIVWFPLPLALPEAPVGLFVPTAINKNLNVVGSSLDAQVAFKWHDPFGYQGLIAPGILHDKPTFATDINDNGYAIGFAENLDEAFPILWTPDNLPHLVWPHAFVRSHPHINNNGDVAVLDGSQNVSVLHLNGIIDTLSSIPDPVSVDGISDEGRLIGTSRVNGALQGWTFYKNGLMWLAPPSTEVGAFVQPTGVNTCGNIVGRVLNQSGGFITGVAYTKQWPFQCDGSGIVHA